MLILLNNCHEWLKVPSPYCNIKHNRKQLCSRGWKPLIWEHTTRLFNSRLEYTYIYIYLCVCVQECTEIKLFWKGPCETCAHGVLTCSAWLPHAFELCPWDGMGEETWILKWRRHRNIGIGQKIGLWTFFSYSWRCFGNVRKKEDLWAVDFWDVALGGQRCFLCLRGL